MFKIWNINILGAHIEKKWEQGDLDIYFGRWEHWADRRFWEMGAPSEKKVGAGRFGEKKWEIGRFRPPHRGPHFTVNIIITCLNYLLLSIF